MKEWGRYASPQKATDIRASQAETRLGLTVKCHCGRSRKPSEVCHGPLPKALGCLVGVRSGPTHGQCSAALGCKYSGSLPLLGVVIQSF